MNTRLLFLLLPLLLSACRSGVEGEDTTSLEKLVQMEWELVNFQQVNGITTDIGSQGILLRFFDDGSLEGSTYTFATPGLGSEYISTYEALPDGSLIIEAPVYRVPPRLVPFRSRWYEYHRALTLATSFETLRENLTIYYEDGQALLFVAKRTTEED